MENVSVADTRQRFNQTLQQVSDAAQIAKQPVHIVAASKQQTIAAIKAAANCGISSFGENYLQEAKPKILALRELDLDWHFIGHIQSNKTNLIAKHFDWVQTVSNVKQANRLNDARLDFHPTKPVNCLIQVNIDQEPQKSGVAPDQVSELLEEMCKLEAIRLRGLMAIPEPRTCREEKLEVFAELKHLFDDLATVSNPHWDTLSIGMTNDYLEAIESGSTMIRLGTALFGPRPGYP